MSEYSVSLEATGVPGSVDEEMVELLASSLAEHEPVTTLASDGSTLGVGLNVVAGSLAEAAQTASWVLQAVIDKIAVHANRPIGFLQIAEITAKTYEQLERENATPNYPELVGVTELAGMVGVSRQRASALAASPSFPRPLADLASGPVWPKASVERFVEQWPRRGGRPRKATAKRA